MRSFISGFPMSKTWVIIYVCCPFVVYTIIGVQNYFDAGVSNQEVAVAMAEPNWEQFVPQIDLDAHDAQEAWKARVCANRAFLQMLKTKVHEVHEVHEVLSRSSPELKPVNPWADVLKTAFDAPPQPSFDAPPQPSFDAPSQPSFAAPSPPSFEPVVKSKPWAEVQPYLSFHGGMISKGMLVQTIRADTLASQMDLQQGDIIVQINDHPLRSRKCYLNALRHSAELCTLLVQRNGQIIEKQCNLPQTAWQTLPTRGMVVAN